MRLRILVAVICLLTASHGYTQNREENNNKPKAFRIDSLVYTGDDSKLVLMVSAGEMDGGQFRPTAEAVKYDIDLGSERMIVDGSVMNISHYESVLVLRNIDVIMQYAKDCVNWWIAEKDRGKSPPSRPATAN